MKVPRTRPTTGAVNPGIRPDNLSFLVPIRPEASSQNFPSQVAILRCLTLKTGGEAQTSKTRNPRFFCRPFSSFIIRRYYFATYNLRVFSVLRGTRLLEGGPFSSSSRYWILFMLSGCHLFLDCCYLSIIPSPSVSPVTLSLASTEDISPLHLS